MLTFAWPYVSTIAGPNVLTFAFAIIGNFDGYSLLGGFALSNFELAFVGMRLPLCVTHGLVVLRARLVAWG